MAGIQSRESIGYQLHFRFWHKVVFVDWHGVMSTDPFWYSILENSKHPLVTHLKRACDLIFQHQTDVLSPWMRGHLETEQIVDMMSIKLDRRFLDDFLVRRLYEDCRRMRCNVQLTAFLRKIRKDAFIVLATDNMDCFLDAVRRSQNSLRGRRRSYEETLGNISGIFDDVLCSSELGTLKCEDTAKFFGPWLSRYNFVFEDALLVDDREDNCEVFRSMGGTAVRYREADDRALVEAIHKVEKWLSKPINH